MNPRPLMNAVLAAALVAVLSLPAPQARAGVLAPSADKDQPLVQLAILLDTSSSMDGLINQARAELWRVVNELATARRHGKRPRLEVALYEYGNSGLAADTGWIRQVAPLTDDLDLISEQLFALRTNGGSEHCGQVIRRAVKDLKWSDDKRALKVIYIAGNEEFTQGPVPYRDACQEAISKGVVVNTIHCGDRAEGERTGWKDGALLADGAYLAIDQNKVVAHIAAPQDAEITRLGVEINATYIAYGTRGVEGLARQEEQDGNASTISTGSMLQRARFKSQIQYSNSSWDLVDASGERSLDDIPEEELPEDMRKMSKKERKAYVAGKKAERERLQKRIRELSAERDAFVAEKRKAKAAEGGPETLDSAIIKSVRKAGAKKSFTFAK